MMKVLLTRQLNKEQNRFKLFHSNSKTFGMKFFAVNLGLPKRVARRISHFGILLYSIKNQFSNYMSYCQWDIKWLTLSIDSKKRLPNKKSNKVWKDSCNNSYKFIHTLTRILTLLINIHIMVNLMVSLKCRMMMENFLLLRPLSL